MCDITCNVAFLCHHAQSFLGFAFALCCVVLCCVVDLKSCLILLQQSVALPGQFRFHSNSPKAPTHCIMLWKHIIVFSRWVGKPCTVLFYSFAHYRVESVALAWIWEYQETLRIESWKQPWWKMVTTLVSIASFNRLLFTYIHILCLSVWTVNLQADNECRCMYWKAKMILTFAARSKAYDETALKYISVHFLCCII